MTDLSPQTFSSVAVGIDLGTSNSLISYVRNDTTHLIQAEPSDSDPYLVPSAVYYAQDKDVYVGHQAWVQARKEGAASTITSSKRRLTEALRADHHYRTHQGLKTPDDVASAILRYLKSQAERKLKQNVTQAVITVPAYFDDAARTRTRNAATQVGFQVLRLINEPTAAALAYGLDKGVQGIYAVYDLGGGTFDFSILKLARGVFQVRATAGDTQLGGDDFDQALLNGLNLPNSTCQSDRAEILSQVQGIKKKLTDSRDVHHVFDIQGQKYERQITQTQYDACIQPILERTLTICADALSQAHLTVDDIKGVILVGGATRTPAVVAAVQKFFQQSPLRDIDPDQAVARGAALQAHALTSGGSIMLLDVCPLSLGIETQGGLVDRIILRNSPVPLSRTQKFTTFKNGQTALLIHVVQGEREQVEHCRSLAKFELRGIPPMAAGLAIVHVTFSLDVDSILTVTAFEQTTGISQQVVIVPDVHLDADQIDHQLQEALQNKDNDRRVRALKEMQLKSQSLSALFQKALTRLDSKLSYDEKVQLQAALNHMLDENVQNNAQDLTRAIADLEEASLIFETKN